VPRGELAIAWDLAAAINVGSWRANYARITYPQRGHGTFRSIASTLSATEPVIGISSSCPTTLANRGWPSVRACRAYSRGR